MADLGAILTGSLSAERLARGFLFTEGPVWDAVGRRLHFSDIPADRIYSWHDDEGLSVHLASSGKSNGLTRDHEGRLIVCQHAKRRVVRIEPDGSETPIAERFEGARLNSPNDVVVKSDGAVYFTDPPYGLNHTFGIDEEPELSFAGVFRIAPDGDLSVVCTSITPNGLAFSPDEQLLYVADTERNAVFVFEVRSGGDLSEPQLFARMTPGILAPDGMKVDVDGRLYVTGNGGVWVFDPSGRLLGTIPVPELPANIAWGGDDGRDLYITARTSLFRVRLAVGGKLPGHVAARFGNEAASG